MKDSKNGPESDPLSKGEPDPLDAVKQDEPGTGDGFFSWIERIVDQNQMSMLIAPVGLAVIMMALYNTGGEAIHAVINFLSGVASK